MIRILKWWDQCENAGSRKLKEIRHFSSQSGNDSRGYRKLMRKGADGVLAFGVFQALCQCMATLSHDARKAGEMVNSDGSALDLDDLSDLTRIPEDLLEPAIDLLVSVSWLERLEPLAPQQSATHPPSSPTDLPPISHSPPKGEERREEEGREEPNGSCRIAIAKSDDSPAIPKFDEVWDSCPEKGRRRSSRKKAYEAWKRIPTDQRPTAETLLKALEAWKACEDWAKDDGEFVPALHRWIRDRKWADLPTPEPNTKPSKAPDIGGRTMSVTKVSDMTEAEISTLPETDEIPI